VNEFRRRSVRLPGHDYTGEAVYFVTLCSWEKQNLFGTIQNGIVQLSPFGEIVNSEWLRTPQIRPEITLGEYMIMPNHFHANVAFVGAHGRAPSRLGGDQDPGKSDGFPEKGLDSTRTQPQGNAGEKGEGSGDSPGLSKGVRAHGSAPLRVLHSLGSMIAGFKSTTTVQINLLRGTPRAPVWQRNYWEHIIRDEEDWQRIADYILGNPLKWREDQLYNE
jgi:hypothetical protein